MLHFNRPWLDLLTLALAICRSRASRREAAGRGPAMELQDRWRKDWVRLKSGLVAASAKPSDGDKSLWGERAGGPQTRSRP